ncbi:MAG: type III pantothenate kinase [Elusimicrobiota bacterium]
MVLVFDIGNTQVTVGLFEKDEVVGCWSVSSDEKKTADEYGITLRMLLKNNLAGKASLEGVVICSVVPGLTPVFEKAAKSYFSCSALIISSKLNLPMKILVDYPKEVGADRLANAVAVQKLGYTPAIVIDMGTATTFDVVDSSGGYWGGVIAPGMEISIQSLAKKTTQLPKIELNVPQNALGRNTRECIVSGIYWGTIGQIKEIIQRLQTELSPQIGGREFKVVLTGGLSSLVTPNLEKVYLVDPYLTLRGIKFIWDTNH